MMEQGKFCAVWPMAWLGSSLNQIQGWTTVPESYSRALEQGSLPLPLLVKGHLRNLFYGIAVAVAAVLARRCSSQLRFSRRRP